MKTLVLALALCLTALIVQADEVQIHILNPDSSKPVTYVIPKGQTATLVCGIQDPMLVPNGSGGSKVGYVFVGTNYKFSSSGKILTVDYTDSHRITPPPLQAPGKPATSSVHQIVDLDLTNPTKSQAYVTSSDGRKINLQASITGGK